MIIGVLDLESTGVDVKEDRIIEYAIARYDMDGTLIDEIEQRINPMKKIAPKAIAVHKIADADVAFSPKFSEKATGLHKIVNSCDFIVGHNALGFDGPMLRNEFARVGLKDNIPPILDTMLHGRGTTADGKLPNLREFCWAYGVDYDSSLSHAALYDVQVLAKAFFNAVKFGDFKIS